MQRCLFIAALTLSSVAFAFSQSNSAREEPAGALAPAVGKQLDPKLSPEAAAAGTPSARLLREYARVRSAIQALAVDRAGAKVDPAGFRARLSEKVKASFQLHFEIQTLRIAAARARLDAAERRLKQRMELIDEATTQRVDQLLDPAGAQVVSDADEKMPPATLAIMTQASAELEAEIRNLEEALSNHKQNRSDADPTTIQQHQKGLSVELGKLDIDMANTEATLDTVEQLAKEGTGSATVIRAIMKNRISEKDAEFVQTAQSAAEVLKGELRVLVSRRDRLKSLADKAEANLKAMEDVKRKEDSEGIMLQAKLQRLLRQHRALQERIENEQRKQSRHDAGRPAGRGLPGRF